MLATTVALVAATAGAQTPASRSDPLAPIAGKWLTQGGEAQVLIEPCPQVGRGPLCGRVVWLRDARNPDGRDVATVEDVTDVLNGDPQLRSRPLLGMYGMYDFRLGGDPASYEEGTIYNPGDGRTYRANVRLLPDGRLRLRGYVGIPLIGKTEIWSRVR